MKKLYILLNFFFVFINSFSQNENCTKATIPIVVINNQQLISIIDSVVSYSEKCYEQNLKHLTFGIDIKDGGNDDYQVAITLMDYQVLDYILKLNNVNNKVRGCFVLNKHYFLIFGCCNPDSLFNTTINKKVFTSYPADLIWGSSYSTWIYKYTSEKKFQLIDFNQVCDKNMYIPKKGETITIESTTHSSKPANKGKRK